MFLYTIITNMNTQRINEYYSNNTIDIKEGSDLKELFNENPRHIALRIITDIQTKRNDHFLKKHPFEKERDALRAEKPRLCKICGECAKWTNASFIQKIHNVKNCPYDYYYNIKDATEYKKIMINVSITELNSFNNMKEEIEELKEDASSTDFEVQVQKDNISELNGAVEAKDALLNRTRAELDMTRAELDMTRAELDDEIKNTKIYKDIFSIEEIKRRKENYDMEKEEMETKTLTFKERELKILIKEKEIDEIIKTKTEKADLTITSYESIKERKSKQIAYYRSLYENANKSAGNIKAHLTKALEQNIILEAENIKVKSLIEEQFKENITLENRLDKYLLTKDKQDNYEGESCSICIENIEDGKGTTTECGHHFHTNCYTSFLRNEFQSKSYGAVCCPNCRNQLINI